MSNMDFVNNGNETRVPHRLGYWLNAILVCAVTVQLALYGNQLHDGRLLVNVPIIADTLYPLSLMLLIGFVIVRYIYHIKLTRRAEAGREQLEAMNGMFSTVKHKLNNDMQVVLGNAELAEILANTGGDTQKPVRNITEAANAAVGRIEQLSVFGSTDNPNPKPIDLNAILRESMARLVEELPSIVTLRMELGQLSSRAVADNHLLSLSLTYLVSQAASSMRHGGEIVVRTFEGRLNECGDTSAVNAEIYIVHALTDRSTHSDSPSVSADAANDFLSVDSAGLVGCLSMTKALVERSGVTRVILARTGGESLFAMRFSSEVRADAVLDDPVVSRLYSLLGACAL